MQRTKMTATFALILFLTVSVLTAAKTTSFLISVDAKINGTTLKRGTYKLALDGDQATIFKGKEKMVSSKINIRPIASGEIPKSSLIDKSGYLRAVMLGKEVVEFLE